MTSISSISSGAVSVLFGSSISQPTVPAQADKTQLLQQTGNTDQTLRTGGAIGKIIEIVAGMGGSGSVFDTSSAQKNYSENGSYYSQTVTGTGKDLSDEDFAQAQKAGMSMVQQTAEGTGPESVRAQAYIAAVASGSVQKTDMSTMGVTATETVTNTYWADGSDRGQSSSLTVHGMDQFLSTYTYVGDDGMLRDKATGKYAGWDANGTQYTYEVYGPTEAAQQAATSQATQAALT